MSRGPVPDVAVITITRGRDPHLHRQRRGLTRPAPHHHVVVGMGERPALHPVPGAPPVTRVSVPVPAGGLPLAAARNAGAATALAAGARLLVFLDVDCIPGPGLLDSYRWAAARTRDRTALLCGPVTYLPPAPPGGYPATGLHLLAGPHPARPAPPAGGLVFDERFELFWSLSFAVSATGWSRLGGFCEDYLGYGGEDTDFAVRAARQGAVLGWVGGADAFHQYHPPSRHGPDRVAEMVRNARLFRRRHGWWPMAGWFTELARDGLVEFDPDTDLLRATPAAVTPAGSCRSPRGRNRSRR